MKLIVRKKTAFPNFVEGAAMDWPRNGDFLKKLDECLLVGWVLFRDRSAKIFIKNINGEKKELKLQIKRPDVLLKVKKINYEDQVEVESQVGFKEKIDFKDGFSLVFSLAGQEYTWLDVQGQGAVSEFWDNCFNFKQGNPLLVDEIATSITVSGGFTSSIVEKIFEKKSFPRVQQFEQQFNQISDYVNIIRTLDEGKFPYLLGGADAEVVSNFFVGKINFILIRDSGVEYFYIQNVSSMDGVYFPWTNDLVVLGHADAGHVKLILQFLSKNFAPKIKKSADILGYMWGFPRPYHFLYDQVPIVQYLTEHDLIKKDRDFYCFKGFDLAATSEWLDGKKNCFLNGDEEVNREIAEYGKPIFKLGIKFQRGVVNSDQILLINASNRNLIERAKIKYAKNPDVIALDKYDFLLWIGITGQKRAWVEQVEGSVKIIKHIAKTYSNPCIVIDGWTSCVSSNAEDQKEAENDMKVFREIRAAFDTNINFYSLIGTELLEKIAVAQKIDFFVANAMTGSMNVARVCGKPGVAHSSKVGYGISTAQHIHPRTFLPDPSMVTDIPDEKNIRVDYCSYSINSDVFLGFFKNSLARALEGDFSNALSYNNILR